MLILHCRIVDQPGTAASPVTPEEICTMLKSELSKRFPARQLKIYEHGMEFTETDTHLLLEASPPKGTVIQGRITLGKGASIENAVNPAGEWTENVTVDADVGKHSYNSLIRGLVRQQEFEG